MIDIYWRSEVNRISPEAPVPVAKVIDKESREGGAANVLNNVRAMGAQGMGLFSHSETPTVKIRVISRSQQMVRIDFDAEQKPITKAEFRNNLQGVNYVIFSDYGKGGLVYVQDLIIIAKEAGCQVYVDPKGYDYTRYRLADVVKPNLDEMRELVGGWATEAELTEKAYRLRKEIGIKAILLTRAAAGMTLYIESGAFNIPSVAKEVYDVSGAGDTAIAAFAVAQTLGHDWLSAAQYANKAAGVAVSRFGTAVVKKEEVF
jgi:rfaE bifunctional protein kinase chain/domain